MEVDFLKCALTRHRAIQDIEYPRVPPGFRGIALQDVAFLASDPPNIASEADPWMRVEGVEKRDVPGPSLHG
jgi:hypothetical protein